MGPVGLGPRPEDRRPADVSVLCLARLVEISGRVRGVGQDVADGDLVPGSVDARLTTATAEALYRVVDAAYEKRSTALSSNLHPAGFDELMPNANANATVDRLLHHAHVVITNGDSIRLTQATRGKGVRPLPN